MQLFEHYTKTFEIEKVVIERNIFQHSFSQRKLRLIPSLSSLSFYISSKALIKYIFLKLKKKITIFFIVKQSNLNINILKKLLFHMFK